MKVLIAPNSFKESLNSFDVAHYISRGLRKSSKEFEIIELPLADGGTGTSRIITQTLEGKFITCEVTGPVAKNITATYGIAPRQRVAIIGLAEAAGLSLIPKQERDPLKTTTVGVGELILDALDNQYRKIILCIGDSSTIDCGVGALSVFGIKFLNRKGRSIDLNCRGLLDLNKIDTSQMKNHIRSAKITIACDVRNILTGKNGALAYARQKGAKPSDMILIDKGLRKFRRIVLKQYQIDLDKIPGSGAAGGIGGAFVAMLGSQIISGFGLIKELTYFEDAVRACDVVITGEGRVDKESFSGKTLERVLVLADIYNKPVILICGHITADAKRLKKYEIQAEYTLAKSGRSLEKAIDNAPKLLEQLATKIGKALTKQPINKDER
jgi:glycerate kinase